MMLVYVAVISSLSFLLSAFVCFKYILLRKQKKSEYYTDYVHNELILRLYKPEFEYQAIGNIRREKLLDGGNFSQFYMWALIEK